jgi:hypothetical protein
MRKRFPLFAGSAAEGIADAEKDAMRLIIESVDGPSRHAAREVEVADGTLEPTVQRHCNLGRHGLGQTCDNLLAWPDALRVVNGWGGLSWNPEIVAPLDLREAQPAAYIGRHRPSQLEIIEGIDHHRIVPLGSRPGSSLIEGPHPGDAATVFHLSA